MVRAEFRKILELEDDLTVVGEAKNGLQAVGMVRKFGPNVVLMDIGMPLLNGLEATREILKAGSTNKIIILSVHDDEAYILEAVQSGAMGYLFKQIACESICTAIREVYRGNTFFSPSIPKHLCKQNPKH